MCWQWRINWREGAQRRRPGNNPFAVSSHTCTAAHLQRGRVVGRIVAACAKVPDVEFWWRLRDGLKSVCVARGMGWEEKRWEGESPGGRVGSRV